MYWFFQQFDQETKQKTNKKEKKNKNKKLNVWIKDQIAFSLLSGLDLLVFL